ncbi:MAG: AI-2E family transporter [Myxococcaceae bacterium]
MQPPPKPSRPSDRVQLEIPMRTVFKVAGAIAILFAVWELKSLLGLVAFALLGAVTLMPLMRWLEKKRVKHGLAVGLLALGIVGVGFGLWELIVPPLVTEVGSAKEKLSQAQQEIQAHPSRSHFVQKVFAEAQKFPQSNEAKSLMKRGFSAGIAAFEGATALIVVLVLMMYLLLDGKRLFAWLLSYVPAKHRKRVGVTAEEVGKVVRAYVRGQLITSVAAGIFVWGSLSLMHVPAAIPMGLFAALMDVLPVLGIIATAVPAALLALTVSPTAALVVVALVLGYHAIENYVLIPVVYGKQLRLSTLSVLLAFMVGGVLAGVTGAVLMLPLVAAYPIIERRWLGNYLSDETVDEHARMDSKSDELAKQAVEDVAEDARPNGMH